MKHLAFSISLALLGLASLAPAASAAADEGFQWSDTKGKHADLHYNGKLVARYIYEPIDQSSPERRELTYKPFHHVFADQGKVQLTKGPGGKFPHHRGIYYGFSKCRYKDSAGKDVAVDTWHCRKAYQVHKKFIAQTAGPDEASQTVLIDWHGDDGKVFAREKRTLTFSLPGDSLVVDFESTVSTELPRVTLDGDPQHAGFQFRASNEVAESTASQTYYIRPKTGKAEPGATINWSAKNDTGHTRDLPWKAMSFVLGGKRYTTVYLDHPDNPRPARYSERDYGRFGSYFVADVTPDKPVAVRYRLVINEGELQPDDCKKLSAGFLSP